MINLLFTAYVYYQSNHCVIPPPISSNIQSVAVDKRPIPVTESKEDFGRGSFYDYTYRGVPVTKTALVAASRTIPRGSRAIVTNIENGKSVVVKITDYGPDVKVHPDRIIDLGSLAFSKIANLSQGVINVKVKLYE